MIPLRVNDVKQYAYCPRIVFFQYAMPVERKATWKIEQGKVEEAQIDRLEKRRKLREYGLQEGKRHFHFWLDSERLGLSGRLDLLIETTDGLFPVDFKWTTGKPHRNHVFQLCAYALLLEDRFRRPVTKGFVYLIPADDAVVMNLTEDLKERTRTLLGEMRRMIVTEEMPPPTPVRNRCVDCEYRNFCGDVF
ncbi:MAG TPA: CRISPR-associated protein Cas4 [candidate division Zixibacteria bacterium]|nr:CRISPR-associated protein Cas4 [candidate division Zixibacteria bacterium]